MRGRGVLAVAIALAGMGAGASTASAAELSFACGGREGTCAITYWADPGEVNDLTVVQDAANEELIFSDPGATMRIGAFAPCRIDGQGARCDIQDWTHLALGDGNDQSKSLVAGGMNVYGGPGNDTIVGSPGGHSSISGDDGNDVIVTADGTNDGVDCGTGDDTAVVDPLDSVSDQWPPDRCERHVGDLPDPNDLLP